MTIINYLLLLFTLIIGYKEKRNKRQHRFLLNMTKMEVVLQKSEEKCEVNYTPGIFQSDKLQLLFASKNYSN